MIKSYKLSNFLFVALFLLSSNMAFAQVNSIKQYVSGIKSKEAQINNLANQKDIYKAIELLNETRRDFDTYVNNYLEDEMRKAKSEDASFSPFLNIQYSEQLTAGYWENRVSQAQKSIHSAKEAFSEGHHQRTLDSQDEVWSYLKAVYGVGKMIKDVADNVSTGQFYDAVKGAKEGVDEFIENYKDIENSRLQILETEAYETNIKTLIRRGEIMEEKSWKFASFMRVYEEDVNEFYRIVERFNQKVNEIKNEAVVNWTSAEYSWNAQKYLTQIKNEAQKFKTGNSDYYDLKEKIEVINEKAETDKMQVYQNIQNSGANNAFERGVKLEEDFDEFYNLSIDVLDECYAFDQNQEKITQEKNYSAPENTSIRQTQINNTPLNQPSNNLSTPPGKPGVNKLFHNRWEKIGDGSKKISFRQNGTSVEIEGKGMGTVQNGVLIYTYTNSEGEKLTDKYTLLEDGLKMQVENERSRANIGSWIKTTSDFGSPERMNGVSEAQIDKYIQEKGKTLKSEYKIWWSAFGQVNNDTDGDNISNDFDLCPNTPRGFDFTNGGVDLAGCIVGQSGSPVTSTSATTTDNFSVSQQPQNSSSSTQVKNTTSNPFAGSTENSSSSVKSNSSTSGLGNTSTTTNTSAVNAEPAKIEKCWATHDNRQGFSSTAIIPVSDLKKIDKLVFKHIRGEFVYFNVYWNGIMQDNLIYEKTKQTIFTTNDLLSKIPDNAYRINVIVNRYNQKECTMQAWLLPSGAAIPSDWNIVGENGNLAGGGSGNNAANNFDGLISKADEAFNRKYWNEGQGSQTSANPKQESLNFLRQAEQLINREKNIEKQYAMVLKLATKYAEYAKRVFANSAKDDFIQLAGRMLGQYSGKAGSVSAGEKSDAFTQVAEGWRKLALSAKWGGHQYNKMYCDTESKKYYDLALNADRTNVQLQKTVVKINAPKKAIPAAVNATQPIPDIKWVEGENLRNMMVENIPIQKEDGPHYMEIGSVKIDLGSLKVGGGKVWLMRSGTENWELLSRSNEYIFVGDKIKTSEDATNVSFTYSADKAFLALRPNSTVTFFDGQIYIERGGTDLYVKKRGSKFLVITPKAVTGCRGTEFSVRVDNAGVTDVHLYEGIIEMRNSSEISYLVPGQTARVENEAEEIAVHPFNIQEFKQRNSIEEQSSAGQINVNSNPFRHVTGGGRIVGGQ